MENNNKIKRLHFGYNDITPDGWLNIDVVKKQDNVYNYNPNFGLPFLDESFDIIYVRDILERISESRSKNFLIDCLRTLNPGGVIRIAIKDLEGLCKNYLNEAEKLKNSDSSDELRLNFAKIELLDNLTLEGKAGKIEKFVKENFDKEKQYIIDRIGKDSANNIKNSNTQIAYANETALPAINSDEIISLNKYCNLFDFYGLKKILKDVGFKEITKKAYNESFSEDYLNYNIDSDDEGKIKHPDEIFIEARKPNYIKTDSIKVAFFNSYSYGGAANAALRGHVAHRAIGLNSVCFTADQKQSSKDCIYPVLAHDANLVYRDEKKGEVAIDKFLNHITAFGYNKAVFSNGKDNGEYCFQFGDSVNINNIPNIDDYDIIHLNWVVKFSDPIIHPEYYVGKKIVWTLHDMNAITGGCHYSGNCEKFKTECKDCPLICNRNGIDFANVTFKKRLEAYSKLDIHVVTPSKWLGNKAKESKLFSRFPITVIPYAQPLNIFKPLGKETIRQMFNVQPSDIILLFTADNLQSERKGFAYLLESLKMLAKSKDAQRFALFVMGNGDISFIKDLGLRVNALGFIDTREMAAIIYNAADALIVPSLEDNLPNTICESLGCGTPVIAFNSGGIPEMIVHKVTGYLAKRGDVNDLYNGIMWVKNLHGNHNVIMKCRDYALAHFNEDDEACKYEKLYKEILGIRDSKSLETKDIKNDRLNIYECNCNNINEQLVNIVNQNLKEGQNKDILKIAVDARCFSYPTTMVRGIGHYAKNLIKTLINEFDDVRLTLYFDAGVDLNQYKSCYDSKNVQFKYFTKNLKVTEDVFLVTDPMSIIYGYKSSLNFNINVPISVIMYDFIPLIYNGYYDEWGPHGQLAYQNRISEIKRQRPQILAISECTKKDSIKFLDYDGDKIKVIMAGLNEQKVFDNDYSDEEVDEVLKKFKIKKPYFLSIGGCDSHKNTELSITSTIKLKIEYENNRKNIVPNFVIVGSLIDPYKKAYKETLSKKKYDNFIFTDFVSQRELGCLYKGATGLLYPSFYEGFGFPVLEAMANGCPVITSNNSSLPEVGGDAVLYIDPSSQDDMAAKMKMLIEDDELRKSLIIKGREQAKKFSWKRTAKLAVDALREYVNECKNNGRTSNINDKMNIDCDEKDLPYSKEFLDFFLTRN